MLFSIRMTTLSNRFVNGGTAPDEIIVKFVPSYEPSKVYVAGSRSGASLAEVRLMHWTTLRPTLGVTVKPVFTLSKFRYFVGPLSMALATPSEPGLLLEVGTIGSPGWVMSDSCA